MYGPSYSELVEKWKKWEIEREQLQTELAKQKEETRSWRSIAERLETEKQAKD